MQGHYVLNIFKENIKKELIDYEGCFCSYMSTMCIFPGSVYVYFDSV